MKARLDFGLGFSSRVNRQIIRRTTHRIQRAIRRVIQHLIHDPMTKTVELIRNVSNKAVILYSIEWPVLGDRSGKHKIENIRLGLISFYFLSL